jgi:hypothetical protein
VIKRVLDKLAPPKAARTGDAGYRKLLKWAALPVTDRRWAAPLSALALGFGLFAGVAIGPGAAGTFATGVPQIIEIPGFVRSSGGGGGGEDESFAAAPESARGFGGEEEESSGFVPVAPVEEEAAPEEETPEKEAPVEKEAEPKQAEKQELTGTVVHINPAASSYTVAETGGTMSTVHAGKLPLPAIAVEVPIRTLANGTLAEAGKRHKTAAKPRATLAGIVTFVNADAAAPSYTVSNKGTSALVKVYPDPSGAVPPLPALGAYASVTVDIEPIQATASSSAAAEETPTEPPPVSEPQPPAGPAPVPPVPPPASLPLAPTCAPDPTVAPPAPVAPKATLWQRQLNSGGAPYTSASFEGIVEAVCPTTAQLLISADDIREAGHDLLFTVPAEIDASGLVAGDSVLANADIAADGSLSLTGLASDERLKGAEAEKAIQGDIVPAKKPKE